MKKIFISLFLLWGALFAEDNTPKDTANIAFKEFYIALEGGEISPFGEISNVVDHALFGGINVRYSFVENIYGLIMFDYAYFKPLSSQILLDGVHQFMGRVGVDFHWSKIRPIVLGAGFICHWTRGDTDEELNFRTSLGGTLTDNETEFGWFARINVPFYHVGKFNFGLNVMWEQLWTLPERSNMLNVGVYIERRIW